MKHYTKEELELYRHGQMSVLGKINCASHLQECDDCRKLLEELKAEDDFVEELRSSLQIYESVAKDATTKDTKQKNQP